MEQAAANASFAGRRGASIVFEDELTMAFVDLRQFHPGHTLVIPRQHFGDVRELDEASGAALMWTLSRLTRAVATAFPNEGLSVWHSIGEAAFQEVPHLHFQEDAVLRVYPQAPAMPEKQTRDEYAEIPSATNGAGPVVEAVSEPALPQKIPFVGVGCIVIRDGHLLLVRNQLGFWSTPGGHLDFGESPEVCAARETGEETGVAVTNLQFVAITNDVLTDVDKHYVTIWMRGETDSASTQISDTAEIKELGWFRPGELPAPLELYFQNLLEGRCWPRTASVFRNEI